MDSRRIFLGALASLLACTGSAQIPEQSPDLTIDAPRLAGSILIRTVSFRASDCAVIEGCVGGTGKRKLLRFDVATPNIGMADLVLGDPRSNPLDMYGNPLFEYSACHGHYHFKGYASYELLSSDGTTVLVGRKQAFCLRDSSRYLSTAGPSNGYTCDYQGITAGWQDVYANTLDCQWLDITGVPAGNYDLRVTIDPGGLLPDSDRTNNVAVARVQIPAKGR